MIKIRKEQDIVKDKPFLSVSQFKRELAELENDIVNHNSLVKGARKTGKTDKILIPAFNMCKNGVLYIDYNNESEDIIKEICKNKNRTVHIFYNKDVNISKIIEYVVSGHIVYFNIRQGKSNDIEHLNLILEGIYENVNKIENRLNILIDNVQYLGKLNRFEELLFNYDNVKTLMTLCYTRQLEDFYGEEFVKRVKEKCYSYDVEKQQR